MLQAVAALQAPGAGAHGRHREAGRVVDEEVQRLQLLGRDDQPGEIVVPADLAAPDAVRGDLGALGQDAHGELLGRHFQGEEGDLGAIGHLDPAQRVADLTHRPGPR